MASDLAREALEPFAKAADLYDRVPKLDIKDTYLVKVPLGDLRRARTAYDAIGSGVKALEWNEITAARSDEDPSHEPTGDYEAVTGIGIYYVECGFGSDSYVFSASLNGNHISSHDDPDEAKAAAQVDFERRVLSCLSTHTAAGAGPVEEADAKAGREAIRHAIYLAFQFTNFGYQDGDGSFVYSAADLAGFEATVDDATSRVLALSITPASTIPSEAKGAAGAGPVGEADFYAVSTRTGMHIGLWKDRTTAENVLREYEGGTLTPLYARPGEEPGEAVAASIAAMVDGWYRHHPAAPNVPAIPADMIQRRLTRFAAHPVDEQGKEHEAVKGLMTKPDPARVWKQQAVKFAHDLDATARELAETRERLEKELLPLRDDLANACRNETIVRPYHVQCLDDVLAALSTQESSAALAGGGKEAGL